ncbi:hypothetical protein T265_06817 [Opisthorchis viverrini]|uniref:Uncharacterized protein n=1 Tax=Opisthorchis viverrini TaxID=6198 RepID=A0A075AD14_OPIVI|nr:hypothetical protein T265_06817 [Opisthorchis viverrini]KER25784.1 hypothetical protein T265_06817 [Opisthorchis viverrini]
MQAPTEQHRERYAPNLPNDDSEPTQVDVSYMDDLSQRLLSRTFRYKRRKSTFTLFLPDFQTEYHRHFENALLRYLCNYDDLIIKSSLTVTDFELNIIDDHNRPSNHLLTQNNATCPSSQRLRSTESQCFAWPGDPDTIAHGIHGTPSTANSKKTRTSDTNFNNPTTHDQQAMPGASEPKSVERNGILYVVGFKFPWSINRPLIFHSLTLKMPGVR